MQYRHLAGAALVGALLAGCTGADPSATAVAVISTDTGCEVTPPSAPAGPITFTVVNDGTSTTEFYLYGADGTKIIGEVENIGPGLTRSLEVEPGPGSYVTACKPGMTGDGIRAGFEVTGA